ncbi:AAA family ATPase [Streptacidiphilus fuscans]|uniref:Nuclease SbcCD subunit C n=1 Tax=Streptacidiphilus fuscans TaxID=2789292 RepID=A0A931FHB8_9ACTN|nr:SMC family ATPase [Streptacidiphilus fuscans]MBF9071676.1 SMC family ATPase [Streptacidiphilus fuscans]
MRLHRLTVTAFGPFGGREEVDFDALASGGLFLLAGPTGAGKTSVLDAVCFALYGSVPGSRGRARSLRSDHALAGQLTEVELELTLGGRRLCILRRPEQHRPKRRGEGSTPEKAQTLLSEWSTELDEWRPRSGSHQEIGAELQQLIGMSRDQFCQVVLLPQGEFANFLHADAQKRRELLGRLFDTGRFGAVEAWLTEHRQRCEKEAQSVQADIAARVERLSEAAGEAPEGVLGPDEALAWAAELRERAALRQEVAEVRHALAAERRAAADERLRATQELFDRQQRHRRALETRDALLAEQPAQQEREQRLARAERAATVTPLLRRLAEAEREAERAAAARGRALSALPVELHARDVQAADLRAEEREALGRTGELRALLQAEQRQAEIVRETQQLERRSADAEEERSEAEAWLADAWPRERQAAQRDVEAARDAATGRDALAERLRAAAQRLEAGQRRDGLATRVATGERAVAGLRERRSEAREAWLELKQRRIEGMAAELAARLQAGEPCAVCGATEHPRPAEAAPDQVTPEAERTAEAAYRTAEQQFHEAEHQLARLVADAAAAQALADSRATAELSQEAESLRREHADAERAEAAGLAAARQLERLEREHEQRAAALSSARETLAAAEEALSRLTAEREQLDVRLTEARAGAASVAARIAALDARAALLGQAAEAVTAASVAADAASAARAVAEEECTAVGFPSAAEAQAAALGAPEAEALRAAVTRHGEGLARARAEAASPELVAAAALPEAEPGTDRAAAAATEAALFDAHSALESATHRVAQLARLSDGLAEDVTHLRPFAERLATATELSQLVAGTSRSNELRMSLENYVLAARLEQVAASAGLRLAAMSGGRYTLEHTDARSRNNARSGLGLQVLDAWTGRYRDTSTLSGGESFFASLALALGLADVVTDEAGGMPLDTLFVDEGFGSLDADALEEVMSVLDSLRERDRAVGIVSHVSELRDRIPNQLHVRKGRAGSKLSQAR